MSTPAGLLLGSGLISLGICLIDFSWRRRKGTRNHGV